MPPPRRHVGDPYWQAPRTDHSPLFARTTSRIEKPSSVRLTWASLSRKVTTSAGRDRGFSSQGLQSTSDPAALESTYATIASAGDAAFGASHTPTPRHLKLGSRLSLAEAATAMAVGTTTAVATSRRRYREALTPLSLADGDRASFSAPFVVELRYGTT